MTIFPYSSCTGGSNVGGEFWKWILSARASTTGSGSLTHDSTQEFMAKSYMLYM